MRSQLRCRKIVFLLVLILLSSSVSGQRYRSKVWIADNGEGSYRNPILYADYSDPDVIRVGDNFYLTASSFNAVPGLPILKSKDLVNWTIIGHALRRQPPFEVFDKPQHGNGVWAPAIRYHKGEFYIFYGDPDYGIYMVKSNDPAGIWSQPHLVKAAKGWIDPCPFWDEDGKAYLVSAMARSRSGIKSILVISRMSPDGKRLLDAGAIVFDGHDQNPTVEGPKLYKRNSYYYIFAPAGGVESGWQLALRAKNIYGPYESKIVLAQGKTNINGPHQGAWVETRTGESWFVHFQDKGVYGRVTHLQPLKWANDWPVIVLDPDNDGTGEPVLRYRKPNVGRIHPIVTPAESDEFNDSRLGLQWQWHANPQTNWAFSSAAYGYLRLFALTAPDEAKNFWHVPNLLLQKFPSPSFTVTTKVKLTPQGDDDGAGLTVMGLDYAYVSVRKKFDGFHVSQTTCKDADKDSAEKTLHETKVPDGPVFLRVSVKEGALCRFSYSTDGERFIPIGEPFKARQGRWIGAKVGIFALGSNRHPEMGYADFDWFRID